MNTAALVVAVVAPLVAILVAALVRRRRRERQIEERRYHAHGHRDDALDRDVGDITSADGPTLRETTAADDIDESGPSIDTSSRR